MHGPPSSPILCIVWMPILLLAELFIHFFNSPHFSKKLFALLTWALANYSLLARCRLLPGYEWFLQMNIYNWFVDREQLTFSYPKKKKKKRIPFYSLVDLYYQNNCYILNFVDKNFFSQYIITLILPLCPWGLKFIYRKSLLTPDFGDGKIVILLSILQYIGKVCPQK